MTIYGVKMYCSLYALYHRRYT